MQVCQFAGLRGLITPPPPVKTSGPLGKTLMKSPRSAVYVCWTLTFSIKLCPQQSRFQLAVYFKFLNML